MATIPFPLSSMPGERPGEGQGRLINAYAEKRGDEVCWRRPPGMTLFATTALSTPRGMIDVGGTLYAAFSGKAVTVNSSGSVVTLLAGALDGSLPVTWARNNKSPIPDVVVVTEIGAFVVTSTTVSAYPDPDLPGSVNSVALIDGFFIFSTPDGTLWASGLNTTAVDALSFARAESNPDGLYRVIPWGSQVLACGPASTEFWSDAGTTPFPLSRTATVPVGLLSPWAIAGFESGWDVSPIFVAQDGTVRMWNGYQATKISIPDVERAIKSVVDKSQLRASVYADAGHSVWCLTGPTFTWCYDVSTPEWFERRSYNASRWRASTTVKFSDRWISGDLNTGNLYEVTEACRREAGDPLVWVVESGPVKAFPQGIRVPSAYFDFTTGQGDPLGSADQQDPEIGIQWSHDGGATWSNTILSRTLGAQGDYRRKIRVNRLGRSTHHGIKFRLTFSPDVYVNFRGGTLDPLVGKS